MAPEPTATPALTQVETTALRGAAMRALDGKVAERPLFADPLAEVLAGPQIMQDTRQLIEEMHQVAKAASGPDAKELSHHYYFTARGHLVDVDVLEHVAALRKRFPEARAVQVACVGAGMDTRPWRLQGLSSKGAKGTDGGAVPPVVWVDVDQPSVVALKQRLLAEAGAQTSAGNANPPAADGAWAHPLHCREMHLVGCSLSPETGLAQALGTQPYWDATLPTVWALEGLMYYLPLPVAKQLLADMAQISPAGGSVALITHCSRFYLENMNAWVARMREARGLPNTTPFFYHSLPDLLTPEAVKELGWTLKGVSDDFAKRLPQVAPDRRSSPAFPDKFMGMSLQGLDIEHTVTLARE